MLCYVLAYLDRVNVGFAKIQMLSELKFSETAYGAGAGAFFIGYVLFGVPSNVMLRRVGARRWISCIMLAWGLLSASMALVATPAQFFTLRLLLGLAEAGFYPGVILYLTCWFPSGRRGQVTSLFQSAIPLAGVPGGPLSGWIMDFTDQRWSLQGWQWLFVIEAAPAFVLGVLVLCYLDDDIAGARWLSAEQKDHLSDRLAADQSVVARPSARAVLADLRVWALGVLVFGLAMGLYGISFWMPTLLKDSGRLSMTEVGYLSAIPNLISVVAMLVVARSSDRTGERRWHVALMSLLGAVGLVGSVVFSHTPLLALASLSLAAAGVMSALPLQWTFVTAFVGGSGGGPGCTLQLPASPSPLPSL